MRTLGLPYFKFLKRESREKGHHLPGQAQFALMQREALENYLLDLIRAVVSKVLHFALLQLIFSQQMFHPAANRLSGFLEISALAINLAQSGGSQYKAGYLKIESFSNKGPGVGRKSAGWSERKESRWCAVRESYLVVSEEPGEVCSLVVTSSMRTNSLVTNSLPYGMSFYLIKPLRLNDLRAITVKV